jgi:hypothetical protein
MRSSPPVAVAPLANRGEDAEVVDGVLVGAPPRAPLAGADAGVVYDRAGRVPPFGRYGRLVSVVA